MVPYVTIVAPIFYFLNQYLLSFIYTKNCSFELNIKLNLSGVLFGFNHFYFANEITIFYQIAQWKVSFYTLKYLTKEIKTYQLTPFIRHQVFSPHIQKMFNFGLNMKAPNGPVHLFACPSIRLSVRLFQLAYCLNN